MTMSHPEKSSSSATGLPAALVRRTAGAGALVLALGGAFAAGHGLAGRGAAVDPAVLLAAQGLGTGRSCTDLRQWYVDHAVDQVTAWGWNGPRIYNALPGSTSPNAGGAPEAGARDVSPSSPLDTTTGSATGTNVQVAAVDEPDVAKASGSLLVRVVDDVLEVYDVSGATPRQVGTAPLLAMTGTRLLLVGDRVVAIGDDSVTATGASDYPTPGTRVRTFDLSDPSHPTEVDNRSYDASLVSARQTGDVVRLVLATPPPSLPFVTPDQDRTEAEALKANRDVVRASSISDWLPMVGVEGGTPRPVVDCADVAVPAVFGGLGTMTVVGFDRTSAAGPAATGDATGDATAVATSSDVAMMSTGHLYVAAAPQLPYAVPLKGGVVAPDTPVSGPSVTGPSVTDSSATGRTTIYAFDLAGTGASYVGAGSVDGLVSSSWSMDEWQGVLRVAAQSAYGGGATSVVLFRPGDGALTRVAAIDGLGAGQQLKAVRWLDGLAVVVTYQQVDPFYALDLADPTHPRVLGVLHLPGWSSYLHPVGPHLVLGLGQTVPQLVVQPDVRAGATSGTATASPEPQPIDPRPLGPRAMPHAKATVFDLSDPTRPRTAGTAAYPAGSTALAGLEPHQVTWLPDRHLLLTIVSDGYGGGGWLSLLTVGDGSLHNRMVRLAPTTDLSSVRTVPLADGRVVLVNGDEVRFVHV
jgi:hypothetical protein